MKLQTIKLGNIAIPDKVIVSPDTIEASKHPYLGLDQIESQTGKIISYDSMSAEGKSTSFAFNSNHVLYGKLRPYLNKVALPQREGRCSTEIIPLLPKGVDRTFLALLLRREDIVAVAMSAKTGSRMPRADMDTLLNVEVVIPETIADQQIIAAKLKAQLAEVETARQALAKQECDVEKLETRFFESIFAQANPDKFVKIGDVAITTSGSTPSRDKKDYWKPGQYAWVKTGEVAYQPIFHTEECISDKALRECSLTLLPPKTVLIAMYGQGKTRGQSAVLEIPATTNQACFAILPNETLYPEYLHYWLRHSYSNLRSLSEGRGGNQANLNGAMLKEFKVPLLPINKQIEIAKSIQDMFRQLEKVKANIQANKKEIALLPNRLLAQAFNQ